MARAGAQLTSPDTLWCSRSSQVAMSTWWFKCSLLSWWVFCSQMYTDVYMSFVTASAPWRAAQQLSPGRLKAGNLPLGDPAWQTRCVTTADSLGLSPWCFPSSGMMRLYVTQTGNPAFSNQPKDTGRKDLPRENVASPRCWWNPRWQNWLLPDQLGVGFLTLLAFHSGFMKKQGLITGSPGPTKVSASPYLTCNSKVW